MALRKRFLLVLVAAFSSAGCVLAVASEETVLSGTLVLSQWGQRVGMEEFEFSRLGGGYSLTSRGSIWGQVSWSARLALSTGLRPYRYELRKEAPQREESILAVWLGDRLNRIRLQTSVSGELVADIQLSGEEWLVLDKDLVSHYVVLAFLLYLTDVREFTAFSPQAQAAVPLSAKMDGLAAFVAPWGNEAARRWLLSLGGEEVVLYEHAGELLLAEVPGQGLSAWRADLFPELPEPYRIQTEMALPPGAREKEVRFDSGGVKLAGTLLLPAGGGPFPAVLFVPGTGEVDRDGSAPEKPARIFRELAYSLAEAGVASLRYDKRGVGKSGGDLSRASMSDLLSDARSALEFLGSRPEIKEVYLVGHSEGTILAPLLARRAEVAGLILVGAPARPLEDVLSWQLLRALQAAEAPEDRISRELAKLSEFVAFVKGSSGDWGDYTPDELRAALPSYSPGEIEGMKRTSLRWWREELAHDPRDAIREVEVPFLALNGGADIRVPPEDAAALAEAARAAGNPDAVGIVVPKMNHWLRFQPGRLLPELVSGPLDPRAVKLLLDWLTEHRGDPD